MDILWYIFLINNLYTSRQVRKTTNIQVIWGDNMKVLERAKNETARDYAFRVIKQNIISLEFIPGTFVSENEIAQELGISRTPVREAIIDMAKASVIETIPQKGNFVTLIDPELIDEARFLRKVLDKAVIELACETDNPELLEKLEENVQLQEFYLEKEASEKILPLDNEFHELIYLFTGKKRIHDMSTNIMIHFDRVRTLSVETVKDMKVVKDHREMLEAIKNHDKETAVALVEKHLNRYQLDKELLKAQYPDYFKK